MPWTFHADLHQYFNGFYSYKNTYGKPGKFFITFSIICMVMVFIPKLWAKYIQLFFSGIIMAYAFKTYHLFASSYNAYSPEKQFGLYALVVLATISFLVALLLPEVNLKNKSEKCS
jgi:hypothetical protein